MRHAYTKRWQFGGTQLPLGNQSQHLQSSPVGAYQRTCVARLVPSCLGPRAPLRQQRPAAAASPMAPLPRLPTHRTEPRRAVTTSATKSRFEAFGGFTASQVALFASASSVVVLGVANRVLYKLALVPLNDYVFFLGQLTTFGYLVVYFSILFFRYKQGIVSQQQLAYPKINFALMGMFDAFGLVLGLTGAARLPGVLLPILSQSFLFWQLLFSWLFLKKQFTKRQVLGVALVMAGVALAALPGGGGSSLLEGTAPIYVASYLASMAFPSLSSIVKEKTFSDSKASLGKPLDIFVVNSYSSVAQAAFVFFLLPVITGLRGLRLEDLPEYLANGGRCFMGLVPDCGGDCTGAPLLPLLYVACNLGFNIAILNFLRQNGALLTSLLGSMVVPLTVITFTMDLPLLGPSPPLGPLFAAGTLLLVLGLVFYNRPRQQTTTHTVVQIQGGSAESRGPEEGSAAADSGAYVDHDQQQGASQEDPEQGLVGVEAGKDKRV